MRAGGNLTAEADQEALLPPKSAAIVATAAMPLTMPAIGPRTLARSVSGPVVALAAMLLVYAMSSSSSWNVYAVRAPGM